jgi:hypothetical protein
MEVHHHPHVEKKGFKEYFLEFLMIFLAVTMGFFAENIREHFSDSKKEKQLILALQKEISEDTATLTNLLKVYAPLYHAWVDSSHLFVDSLPLYGNERKISQALFNATIWKTYTPPEIALSELKSSGNFSLVENERVKKGIMDYSVALNNFIKYNTFITVMQHSVDTSLVTLIPREVSRTFTDKLYQHDNFLTDADIPRQVQFKTYSKQAFVYFLSRLDQADNQLQDISGDYKILFNEDKKLLKLLEAEYHLKDND